MPEQTAYSLTLRRAPAGHLPLRPWASLAALTASFALFVYLLTPHLLPAPSTPLTSTQVAASAPAETSSTTTAVALVSETSSIAVEAPGPLTASLIAAPPVVQPATSAPAELSPVLAASQPAQAPAAAPPDPSAPQAASVPGQRWLAEGFVFVIEGQEWDADSFGNVDAALSKLPARIRAQLANRALGPVQIMVNRSGRTLSGKQPYGGAANFFSTNDSRNELVLFPAQSTLTILHEMGHAYNLRQAPAGKYALVLLDPEMQSFMAAAGWRVLSTPDQVRAARDHMGVQMAYEGQSIWPRLSNNDPLEDFANSFALYFFSPDDLRVKSPERFAWFEGHVGR